MTDKSKSNEVSNNSEAVTSKQIPPGFLRDNEGKPSSMRLMSFIALFSSIWFGWITINGNETNQNGIYITTAFLLAAFAPKALQKFIEDYYQK